MIGRLQRPVDFERVLGTAPRARSPHFAVHHLAAEPAPRAHAIRSAKSAELSTGHVPMPPAVVDDSPAEASRAAPARRWLGAVVPKRWARRAVTRNLLKRQIREAIGGEPRLPSGLWVVRLRAAFDRADFASAASPALRAEVRAELADVLAKAAARSAAGR